MVTGLVGVAGREWMVVLIMALKLVMVTVPDTLQGPPGRYCTRATSWALPLDGARSLLGL